MMTYDIVEYLSSMVTEDFSIVVGESELSVLDLATEYRKLSGELQQWLNAQAAAIGVQFSDILIENISLPDEIEKLIDDEQFGISMAKQDMALGNIRVQGIQATANPTAASKSMVEQLWDLQELLD